jgi:SAM-dependent methyltransferase
VNPEEYRRLADLEATHWWYRGLHAAVFDLIERHRALLPPHPILLDAGCGTGFVARRLAALGKVVAVDVSEHAAEYWKTPPRPPKPRFVRASVTALPFRDRAFDLVVSLDVLYHRAVGDDLAAARELARVLRPGGLLLLNLPAYEFLQSRHDRAIHTARRYTRGRVRTLLVQAGLAPLRLGHWNTLLFPLAAAARLWGRLRPTDAHGSDVQPAPPWQDALFSRVLAVELALRQRWDLPFGLSVICLARKVGGVAGIKPEETACRSS